jgi:ribonucleotide reductase class II
MDISQNILSSITVFLKYAKYLPEKERRETWEELVERNKTIHINKYPDLRNEIHEVYDKFVMTKKVLPSMRSLQFAGKPIEISPVKIYNCAFAPIDDWRVFSEIMFLLLSGTGVGFSVQHHHIEKLPEIIKPDPKKVQRYLVGDSIEGWADAIKMLMKSYFVRSSTIEFDFSDIRAKGARLITSGGKAPGPQPLKECVVKVQGILDSKVNGEKLSAIEIYDIVCHIADAVLAGGIRRAALICLFSANDDEMIASKSGSWWELNPQRGRANNSVVLLRHKITRKFFDKVWERIKDSGSGEPGVYFTNDKDWGTNPSLRKGTRVLTTEGIFPIEELQDREFQVKNLNGEISGAKCWLSGRNRPLFKITLRGNHEVYCTAEHEWPIWNETRGLYEKIRTEDITVNSYVPNLQQDSLFIGGEGSYDDGFLIGWNLGDGSIGEDLDLKGNIKRRFGFFFSKEDMKYDIHHKIFNYINSQNDSAVVGTIKDDNVEYSSNSKFLRSLFDRFEVVHKSKGLPLKTWRGSSEEFRKGLIDGLFSSDGSVEDGKWGRDINFHSVHEKLTEDVGELLGFYGIRTTIKKIVSKKPIYLNGHIYNNCESFILTINAGRDILHFHKLFQLSHLRKQENIKKNLLTFNEKRLSSKKNRVEIINIEKTDLTEDVWDISVHDKTHCFQIAHCITGNCVEIALRPFQFCNLTEVNASNLESQEDLNDRVRAAAFIGTLQAGYTNFHYLRPIWKKTTEKDALLGVSMTGIASMEVFKYNIEEAVEVVREENKRIAKAIGINKAARLTCVKPAGTTSLTLGTSSGIHAWHNDYYIRRIRVNKAESLYTYLSIYHPDLVKDEIFRPHDTAVIEIPQKAPASAVTRQESAIQLLDRVKDITTRWVRPGHNTGSNTHNVSATISIKPEEWDEVNEWMWKNRDLYAGLAILPHSEHSYKQAPFEDISKETYDELFSHLQQIDLTKAIEVTDQTKLGQEAACAGASCEVV